LNPVQEFLALACSPVHFVQPLSLLLVVQELLVVQVLACSLVRFVQPLNLVQEFPVRVCFSQLVNLLQELLGHCLLCFAQPLRLVQVVVQVVVRLVVVAVVALVVLVLVVNLEFLHRSLNHVLPVQ
jgi:hypothetical protein